MVEGLKKLSKFRLQYSIFLVMVAIWVLFLIGSPRTFLSAEIDLSFPSIMGFAGWVFTIIFTTTGNICLAFFACLVTGIIAGFLNGVIVAKLGIPSLVATIGTMFFWRGLVMVCTGGWGKSLVTARDTVLYSTLVGRIGGRVPSQIIWTIFVAVILWLFLNRHRFGAHVYLIGDNIESARMMGVGVDIVKMIVFSILGLLAAFAGVIASLEVSYYWPSLGEGYLLRTMSAVFLGGTSVFGGTGTIFGTFIGALIIGCLEAGIVAMGLTGFWTQLIYGVIIVISVAIHSFVRKRSPI
jgi:simple sugar transport system permease protein